jgi:hypothetical protein
LSRIITSASRCSTRAGRLAGSNLGIARHCG